VTAQLQNVTVEPKKGKGSPYSIAERRVPDLGSQPAGDVSHKPGGRLPLLSARPAVTPATLKRAATNFAAWWTEAQWVWTVCLRQRRGCDLNPGPSAPESSTLTTRLPSHRESLTESFVLRPRILCFHSDAALSLTQQVVAVLTAKGRIAAASYRIKLRILTACRIHFTMGQEMPPKIVPFLGIQAPTWLLNSTSIYGHRCEHLNVRIYLT